MGVEFASQRDGELVVSEMVHEICRTDKLDLRERTKLKTHNTCTHHSSHPRPHTSPPVHTQHTPHLIQLPEGHENWFNPHWSTNDEQHLQHERIAIEQDRDEAAEELWVL